MSEAQRSEASASTVGLCVGGRVRLLKDIWDGGEDHHPPGWIAQSGEVLIIKEVRGDVLANNQHLSAFPVVPRSGIGAKLP